MMSGKSLQPEVMLTSRVTPHCVTLLAETQQNDKVQVVGNTTQLGMWNPGQGVSLCNFHPFWTAEMIMSRVAECSETVEFKFVILHEDGTVTWEHGRNRSIDVGNAPEVYFFNVPDGYSVSPVASLVSDPTVMVVWKVFCDHTLGNDDLVVVGSTTEMGNWQPSSGLYLSTSSSTFPMWSGAALMTYSQAASLAWKLVLLRRGVFSEWEVCHNRQLTVGGDKSQVLHVHASFERLGDVTAQDEQVWPPHELLQVSRNLRHSASEADCCMTPSTPCGSFLSDTASTVCMDDLSSLTTTSFGSSSGLWLQSGGSRIPKNGAACEDAYFNGAHSLGVADGVGSMQKFRRYGVDCAAYAEDLMTLAQHALQDDAGTMLAGEFAAQAMQTAESQASTYGATTATLLTLRENGVIGVANLGDSGFMVVRGLGATHCPSIVSKSREQQHHWNCPFQLMRLPPALAARLDPETRLDSAMDAESYEVNVEPGDLVLLYTDGLSDNLHEAEILELLQDQVGAEAQAVAAVLSKAAKQRSLDEHAVTPFSSCAQLQGVDWTMGGKEDDITVVAAWVRD